jgi:hypothetical protein
MISHTFRFLLTAGLAIIILSVLNLSEWRTPKASSDGMRSARSLHPIEELHTDRLTRFQEKLKSQSTSLRSAVIEYERRYNRSPPPGFEDWFYLAKSHDFVFIDEFDTIMQAIKALWDVPTAVLRARQESLWEQPIGISFFKINSSQVNCSGHGGVLDEALQRRLERYLHTGILPDVDFLVNLLDEPRLLPRDLLEDSASNNEMSWHGYGQSAAAHILEEACLSRPATNDPGIRPDDRAIHFIDDSTDASNFCQHPELFQQHGFLQTPDHLILTHDLVPILSPCSAAQFGDVPFPSVYRELLHEQDILEEFDTNLERPWDDKSDILYWSGASTGMHTTPGNWRSGHRQRLAISLGFRTAGNDNVTLLKSDSSGWSPHRVPFPAVSHLFDVTIKRIVQCEEPACQAMSATFLPTSLDSVSTTFDHKFVLDIDGNTWSGRYHRLLQSRSCVFKMTIFHEAQDDHLTPWVHFVPVSMAATELPEMMRFFTADPSGRRISRDIAEAGRYAVTHYLREVDADMISIRVLLELARIMNG